VTRGWLLVTAFAASCASSRAPDGPFTCSQVMGVAVTAAWFHAGFEEGRDDRWQARAFTGAYLPVWADAKVGPWSRPASSPCARSADAPDRLALVAVYWDGEGRAAWATQLRAFVDTAVARYPRLARIDLMTGLRGPGNRDCGSGKTTFPAFADEAIALVAAERPHLVRVGPRVELPSCALFANGGPYLTDEGNHIAARLVRRALLSGRSR
jgi:hypothetical protein